VPSLEVRGPLDSNAVSELIDRVAALPGPRAVRLDLTRVTAVDPVGAARLWSLAKSLQLAGCAMRLAGLPARFARRLRLHPLIAFVEGEEDVVFSDPFGSAQASAR
jgi:anti-anti-sigma regulatory factor